MRPHQILLLSDPAADLADLLHSWATEDRQNIATIFDADEVLPSVGEARRCNRPFTVFVLDDRGQDWARLFQISMHLLIQEPQARVILCLSHSIPRFEELFSEVPFHDRLLAYRHPVTPLELRLGLATSTHSASPEDSSPHDFMENSTTRVCRRKAIQTQADTDHLVTIGRLAAGLAHEINTPIQFINDSVFFLEEAFEELSGLLQERQRLLAPHLTNPSMMPLSRQLEHLDEERDRAFFESHLPGAFARINEGLKQVNNIVQTIRDFAPGQNDPVATSDLHEAVHQTLMIARHEVKNRAEVVQSFSEVGAVQANPSELKRVVLNLVINAVHAIEDRFGGASGGQITIKTWQCQSWAFLEISDNGCGIPSELHEQIFQPFFSTKGRERGTGQGLAIVQAIVDRFGGTIRFTSEVGRGTTFTVKLPRVLRREDSCPTQEVMIG